MVESGNHKGAPPYNEERAHEGCPRAMFRHLSVPLAPGQKSLMNPHRYRTLVPSIVMFFGKLSGSNFSKNIITLKVPWSAFARAYSRWGWRLEKGQKWLILQSQKMFQTFFKNVCRPICVLDFNEQAGERDFLASLFLMIILMRGRTAWSLIVPPAPQVYSPMCAALHDQIHCVPIKRPIDRSIDHGSTDRSTDPKMA